MIFVLTCRGCRGEGRRSQPPYEAKYHDRPLRWRAAEDCDECGGTGTRPATPDEIAAHHHAAQMDHVLAGVRFPD